MKNSKAFVNRKTLLYLISVFGSSKLEYVWVGSINSHNSTSLNTKNIEFILHEIGKRHEHFKYKQTISKKTTD